MKVLGAGMRGTGISEPWVLEVFHTLLLHEAFPVIPVITNVSFYKLILRLRNFSGHLTLRGDVLFLL